MWSNWIQLLIYIYIYELGLSYTQCNSLLILHKNDGFHRVVGWLLLEHGDSLGCYVLVIAICYGLVVVGA